MRTLLFLLIFFLTRPVLADQHIIDDYVTMPSDNPRLIYTYRPSTQGTNSQGYFDNEYSYEKKEGIYRIVVIGDSVAGGLGVATPQTFAKILEKKLNPLFKKKYEVIVLARSGYSTSQEMVLFEEEAFLYDPDLIIWSYILNDPSHPLFHDTNGGLAKYHFKPKDKFKHMMERRLFNLEEKYRGRSCPKEFHAFLQCAYWDRIVADINKIAKIINEKNIPLIFLIHPVFQEDRDFHHYSLTKEHNQLMNLARQQGFYTLDVLQLYKPYNPNKIKLHDPDPNKFDPWHPNAKGHLIIGKQLFKMIKEKKDEFLK